MREAPVGASSGLNGGRSGPEGPSFTAAGEPAAEARVQRDLALVADALVETLGTKLSALLLAGGYARGEGGVIDRGDGPAPYNDYDLIVVVRGGVDRRMRSSLHALSHTWSERMGLEVDLWPISEETLPSIPSTLFWLDVSLGGIRLVHGDTSVLARIRPVDARSVSLDECGRLLSNRAVGIALSNLERATGDRDFRAARHIHKAVLACGDVRLLAANHYAPTVAGRCDALDVLRDAPDVGAELAAAYRDAASFRARPDRWVSPKDFWGWYDTMRGRIATWHLTYEAWRVAAPRTPLELAEWKGRIYGQLPDIRLGGSLLAHLRAAGRRIVPALPYVGHPRERIARVAVALAYGPEDPGCRRIAAQLLGAPDVSDKTLRAHLDRLIQVAG